MRRSSRRKVAVLFAVSLVVVTLYLVHGHYSFLIEKPPYSLVGNVNLTVLPNGTGGSFLLKIELSREFRNAFRGVNVSVVTPAGVRVTSSTGVLSVPLQNGTYGLTVDGVLDWKGRTYHYSARGVIVVRESSDGSLKVTLASMREEYRK